MRCLVETTRSGQSARRPSWAGNPSISMRAPPESSCSNWRRPTSTRSSTRPSAVQLRSRTGTRFSRKSTVRPSESAMLSVHSRTSPFIRESTFAESSSRPWPVSAEIGIASGTRSIHCSSRRSTPSTGTHVSGRRSALLRRSSRGWSVAPISSSTFSTVSYCMSALRSATSSTMRITWLAMASSSVARKLATRWCGRRCTNPTVSESMAALPPPRFHCSTRVPSVAKSLSAAYAPPRVRRLKRLLLPAFV